MEKPTEAFALRFRLLRSASGLRTALREIGIVAWVLFLALLTVGTAGSAQYVVLEGGGPDQGPGRDVDANVAAMAKRFGAMTPGAERGLAYGVQQLRILSRSAEMVRSDVEHALDLAERSGVPVFLHVDSCYGWGADTAQGAEAPAVKFWENPEMREWDRFPEGGRLPGRVPRAWLCWGPWCSPAPAVPAFGSAKFVAFATSQLDEGVLAPLAARLKAWEASGRRHLFAGINIAWEAHVPDYGDPALRRAIERTGHAVRAEFPEAVRGVEMEREFVGRQLGYASLHWRGWNEERLVAAAAKEGVTREEKFRQICYESLHDYMESLARACHQRGLGADEVYTHIVALASVGKASTTQPPIWTAVNRFSTPGFTMDNRGGAKFDLAEVIRQIHRADTSREPQFGVVESYFRLGNQVYVTDAASCCRELETMFAAGARVQVVFGGFPLEAGRMPGEALQGLQRWLDCAKR